MENRRFTVSADDLKVECLRRKYCDLLSQPEVFPSEENWEFIISYRLHGLGSKLYRKFLVSHLLDEDQRSDYHLSAIRNFPRYLRAVDRADAIATVYSDPLTSAGAFVSLVHECQLFDCEQIGELIDKGYPDLAAELLDAFQPEYDGDTIDAMQFLLSKFDSIPALGSIEIHKGMFKTERRYICPDGHSNPHDAIYCCEAGCGKDIRGLTADNRRAIELFSERVEILREMLD